MASPLTRPLSLLVPLVLVSLTMPAPAQAQGRFFLGVGERMDREAAKAYGPGSYIANGPGVPAYMWVEEVTVVQIHGVGPFKTEEVGAQDVEGR